NSENDEGGMMNDEVETIFHSSLIIPPSSFFLSPCLQVRFDVVAGEVVEAAGDERSPAGLVRSAEAAPGLAVEVFVEEDEFAPVRVVGEAFIAALPWRVPLVVRNEDAREPMI